MSASTDDVKSLAVAVAAFVLAAVVAVLALYQLPVSFEGVEAARRLGIVSPTVLDGYADDMEATYYAVGMAVLIAVGGGLWAAWALTLGARGTPRLRLLAPCGLVEANEPPRAAPPERWSWLFAYAVFPLLLVLLTFRWDFFWVDRGAWGFFAEEGFQLGWINALLDGRVLYRDVYCFNGPLMIYPAAASLRLFGERLEVMRAYVYGLNVAGIVLTYYGLLRVVRHRVAAYLAGLALVVMFFPHWQHLDALSTRFFLGLFPIFTFALFVRRRRAWLLYVTGLLLGVCLFFSPEMGVSATIAVAGTALAARFQLRDRWSEAAAGWLRIGSGVALVAAAVCVPLALAGALGSFAHIMYTYPRYTMMGFAALPFPNLPGTLSAFHAGEASGWQLYAAVVAYLPPLIYGAFALALLIKWLQGRFAWRETLAAGVAVYGAILFRAAIARSDPGHFYMQPILVLCVVAGEDLLAAARSAANSGRRGLAAAFAMLAALLVGSLPVQAAVASYAAIRPFAQAMVDRAGVLVGKPSRLAELRQAGYAPLALPRAPRALGPPEWREEVQQIVRFIDGHVPAGEPILVYPNSSILYFLCDRPNATRFGMTYYAITAEDRREFLEQLRRDPPRYVIWHGRTASAEGIPEEERSPLIQRYLQTQYRTILTVSPFARILERR